MGSKNNPPDGGARAEELVAQPVQGTPFHTRERASFWIVFLAATVRDSLVLFGRGGASSSDGLPNSQYQLPLVAI